MIDYTKIAEGVEIASDQTMPGVQRTKGVNPFTPIVEKAAKDKRRRDLPGSFSLTPYEGAKRACEAYTVMNRLHQAAKLVGVKLAVRRFDITDTDCRIAFKVVEAEAKAGKR